MARLTYNSISRSHVPPLPYTPIKYTPTLTQELHNYIMSFLVSDKDKSARRIVKHIQTLTTYTEFIKYVTTNNQPSSLFQLIINERPVKICRLIIETNTISITKEIELRVCLVGTLDNDHYYCMGVEFEEPHTQFPEPSWYHTMV
jgi:hypothetical protein